MPIDSVQRGSNTVQTTVLVDPTNTVANMNVSQVASADGVLYSSSYGPLVGSLGLLLNAGGNLDRQRAAIGTTGIPAVNTEGVKATYSVAIFGFTPVATPTDIFQIIGSGSKTVRVLQVSISGICSSGSSVQTLMYKRSTANSGGTVSAQTAIPHDSNSSAATAVVNTYTVNAGSLGTAAQAIRARELPLPVVATPGTALVWDFTTRNGQGIVLRGATQGLSLNWNGVAVPGGSSLTIEIEWSEE